MTKCKHVWDDYWHMGYIIGRVCKVCDLRQLRSAEWCRKRMVEIAAK